MSEKMFLWIKSDNIYFLKINKKLSAQGNRCDTVFVILYGRKLAHGIHKKGLPNIVITTVKSALEVILTKATCVWL